MEDQPRTPSPKAATPVPTVAPEAPQTPGGREPSLPPPQTPSSSTAAVNAMPVTPGGPTTPGGSHLRGCTTDKELYMTILVHTAKCSECDKRNMDTMLRCPGCTFQICKPCRERREKSGRELTHGTMGSPSSSIFRSGGLGSSSAGITRKKLVSVAGSISPSPGPARTRQAIGNKDGDGDVAMGENGEHGAADESGTTEGKGKGKSAAVPVQRPVSKKRNSKPKPKPAAVGDGSDDDFGGEPTSATGNKRRRTTVQITNSPTATSARPSRNISATNTYIISSSPGSESSAYVEPAGNGRTASSNNTQPKKPATAATTAKVISQEPRDRIQELLEQHGVNTPENPYQEHFLGRQNFVNVNPAINMPPAGRLGKVVQPRNGSGSGSASGQGNGPDIQNGQGAMTVRLLASAEATKYQDARFSADENEELVSSVLAAARKWANMVFDQLLSAEKKKAVVRGLGMRLDLVEASFQEVLKEKVKECAAVKVGEFEAERQ